LKQQAILEEKGKRQSNDTKYESKRIIVSLDIVEVDLQKVLPVRHRVLWPDKPLSFCNVAGDEEARHFAVMLEQCVVSVASIYLSINDENKKVARLRKFATLMDHQNKGFGGQLLEYILKILDRENVSLVWLDARQSTMPFYCRFGFSKKEGAKEFFKSGIAYVQMEKYSK